MAQSRQQFHAFTVKHSGRANRLLTDVRIAEAFDPKKVDGSKVKHHACKALWDTGATRSVVSPEVVKALGLTPTGVANISHAGGTSQCNTYVVNIELPNHVEIVGIQATEFPGQDGFEVIIGMDIIGEGDFAVTHCNGKTCLSYRIPSIEEIDYVAESKEPIRSEPAPGRNSPCPCGKKQRNGSPMKYKNCCGKAS